MSTSGYDSIIAAEALFKLVPAGRDRSRLFSLLELLVSSKRVPVPRCTVIFAVQSLFDVVAPDFEQCGYVSD